MTHQPGCFDIHIPYFVCQIIGLSFGVCLMSHCSRHSKTTKSEVTHLNIG